MLEKLFNRFEDPSQPLLGPNIISLKTIGLIMPKNKALKLLSIFNQILLTIFMITEWIEVYYLRSDINLLITNVKLSILGFVCVVKGNTFMIWQNKWNELFDYVSTVDIEDRKTKDPVRKQLIVDYTKYSRKLTYFYWMLSASTIVCLLLTPIAKFITTPNYHQKILDGVEQFPHILSAWFPLDKNSFPVCWFVVIWQLPLCFYGGSILATYDSSVLVIINFFSSQLDMMQIKCSEMFNGNITDEIFAEKIKEFQQMRWKFIR